MKQKDSLSATGLKGKNSRDKIDKVVAKARDAQTKRERGYREKSLKIHPWICSRCAREFTNRNIHLLTVHHKDHNHENNPPDGSNWENMCIYCHDNEHQRYLEHVEGGSPSDVKETNDGLTHNPFAALEGILKKE
jgi:hypothetical protein